MREMREAIEGRGQLQFSGATKFEQTSPSGFRGEFDCE